MPGARIFFFACLLIAAAVLFLPLAAALPQQPVVTESVISGFGVWRRAGCEGCHAIYGQGGSFASDLTQIYNLREEAYLREFLANPGAFHPTSPRVMPRIGLTRTEVDALLAFLSWVGETGPARTWPGAVTRLGSREMSVSEQVLGSSDDPAARGRLAFSRPPGNCASCHSLLPNVVIVGPSLAGIATRAGERVPGQSAEEYLRMSILSPGDFIVPGFANVMAQNLGEVLSADQINDIIAFLLTLE